MFQSESVSSALVSVIKSFSNKYDIHSITIEVTGHTYSNKTRGGKYVEHENSMDM